MQDSIIYINKALDVSAENHSVDTSNDPESDLSLIESVLAGNERAFEIIVERYKRLVTGIAGRYFQQAEEIEEVIQISFVKLYFDLKNFRGDHKFSLASWLGRCATNTCLDVIKRQNRRPESLMCESSETEILLEAADESVSEESKLIDRDLSQKLLSTLNVSDQALLQMLYAEEMSVGEISKLTGLSKSNIKIKAFRARNILRKALRKFL